ncbi:hypothetical protein BH09DEP1_BH09DEP1_3180 [soil metagenome]
MDIPYWQILQKQREAQEAEKKAAKEKNEKDLITRIKSRYKDTAEAKRISELSQELIIQKRFGPELADLLDLEFAIQEYTYKGQGIYAHARGPNMHSYPRHLCEPGVDEQTAQKEHSKYEAPSYVDPYGHRHYAFMH